MANPILSVQYIFKFTVEIRLDNLAKDIEQSLEFLQTSTKAEPPKLLTVSFSTPF